MLQVYAHYKHIHSFVKFFQGFLVCIPLMKPTAKQPQNPLALATQIQGEFNTK